jgi:DNA repair photolyase
VSVTTLDAGLCGKLEPRASRPEHRIRAIRMLTEAGVRVGVNVAPVIPGLTDHELPAILEAAAAAGATRATFITLRLPHTVKDVFLQWLETHEPGKKDRVLSRLRDLHGGKLYNSNWGQRLKGEGIFAEQIQKMFEVHSRRLGLQSFRHSRQLSTEHFRRPGGTQLELI